MVQFVNQRLVRDVNGPNSKMYHFCALYKM